MTWLIMFAATFIIMEFNAWWLHKYVMHGFGWWLHEDHHVIDDTKSYQRNDAFALFFAVPSFLLILADHLAGMPLLGAVGFGIMAYGAAYFFVHEVVIHKRVPALRRRLDFSHWYFQAVIKAHYHHHQVLTKMGARNFGMLVVPLSYFKEARAKASRSAQLPRHSS